MIFKAKRKPKLHELRTISCFAWWPVRSKLGHFNGPEVWAWFQKYEAHQCYGIMGGWYTDWRCVQAKK